MLDSKGVISKARTDLNEQKRYFATDRTDIHTLAEAIKDADVFLGLSKGNTLSQDMVRSMAPMLSSLPGKPDPGNLLRRRHGSPSGRIDGNRTFGFIPIRLIMLIGFPYIFRGALDTQAKASMKR